MQPAAPSERAPWGPQLDWRVATARLLCAWRGAPTRSSWLPSRKIVALPCGTSSRWSKLAIAFFIFFSCRCAIARFGTVCGSVCNARLAPRAGRAPDGPFLQKGELTPWHRPSPQELPSMRCQRQLAELDHAAKRRAIIFRFPRQRC